MTATFASEYRASRIKRWSGGSTVQISAEEPWPATRTAVLRLEFHLGSPIQSIPTISADDPCLHADGRPIPAFAAQVAKALQSRPGRQAPGWTDSTAHLAELVLDKCNNPRFKDEEIAEYLIKTLTNWWGIEVEGKPGTGLEETRYAHGDLKDPEWVKILHAAAPNLRADAKRALVKQLAEQAF
jgi:hypothetical protein